MSFLKSPSLSTLKVLVRNVLVGDFQIPTIFINCNHVIWLLGTMVARKPTDQIDCAPFVVGMITVLKQFHSEFTEQFFACCGQYVRSLVEAAATK